MLDWAHTCINGLRLLAMHMKKTIVYARSILSGCGWIKPTVTLKLLSNRPFSATFQPLSTVVASRKVTVYQKWMYHLGTIDVSGCNKKVSWRNSEPLLSSTFSSKSSLWLLWRPSDRLDCYLVAKVFQETLLRFTSDGAINTLKWNWLRSTSTSLQSQKCCNAKAVTARLRTFICPPKILKPSTSS